MNQNLFDFITACPTPFHAVDTVSSVLEDAGYVCLDEFNHWSIDCGSKYYVTRNGSSLIAFSVPENDFTGFMITASHDDSPSFKIKVNPEITENGYVRISSEGYGGMLCASWMDRPLSVAGRIAVRAGEGFRLVNIDLKDPCLIIPSVAIHMNREANNGTSYNKAVDMLPLYCSEDSAVLPLITAVANDAGVTEDDIISTDLFIYNPQPGVQWGDYISAPRLDDLQCVYGCLQGFLNAQTADSFPVFCMFDNEEVGSTTKQGADSSFLTDVISGICSSIHITDEERRRRLALSMMVSADNAHAVHPNHPEFRDKNHSAVINKGIVIKYNANQKYTSDAISTALFKCVCDRAGVLVQYYTNRADMAGGGTLGNISNSHLSLNTVDIGLPQLAMHSSFETAGALDTEYLSSAIAEFYSHAIIRDGNGYRFA